MKYKHIFVLALVLLTFTSSICLSASTAVDRMIRSAQSMEDSKHKVDTLNEIAWLLRKKRDTTVFKYARLANQLADRLNYEVGLGDSYVRLGLHYFYNNRYILSIEELKKALGLRKELEDYPGIVSVYLNLGNAYFENGEFQWSFLQYKKGLQAAKDYQEQLNEQMQSAETSFFSDDEKKALEKELIKIEKKKAKLYSALGGKYSRTGILDSAFVYIQNSIELRTALEDYRNLPRSLMELGIIQKRKKNYENALNTLNEATDYTIRQSDSSLLAKCFLNIGNVHQEIEQYDSAYHYYQRANEIYERTGRKMGMVIYHNNSAQLYMAQEKYEQAKSHLDESLAIAHSINDFSGIRYAESLMGDLLTALGNQRQAIPHFQRAIEAYVEDDKVDVLLRAATLQKIASSYQSIGNYKEANNYLSRHVELENQIETSNQRATDLELLYEKERATAAQRDRVEAELASKELFTRGVVIIALLIVGIVLLLYFYNAQKRGRQLADGARLIAEQKEKLSQQKINELLNDIELSSSYAQIEGEMTERKRIGKDLHDRVGSMLTTVNLMLSAYRKGLPELPPKKRKQFSEANEVLMEANEEVRRISHNLHDGKLEKYGLVNQMEEMANRIESTGFIKVHLSTHNMAERLELKKEVAIYRIIQELVGNVLKHAHASSLTIQINRFKDRINVMVEDDGKGFNQKDWENNKSGIGLNNVFKRVQGLSGHITVDSGKGAGTSVSIDFPITKDVMHS
ncbi:MAG: sensor histidine kinase [Bacteroidota bacterium]